MENEHRRFKSRLHSSGSRDCGIRGMESVVATVTGYHGSERFKLIKLINHTGANYVGAMTKSTTHLVCWELEGRKFLLAREFGTMIVSHRWFEDCAKEGKRLPEHPYLLQSGKRIGPLLWEPPLTLPNESFTTKDNDSLIYDRSNLCNNARSIEINKESLNPSLHLLTENLIPDLGKENRNSRKSKKTVSLRNSEDVRLSIKDFFLEHPSSRGVRKQHGESSSYATSSSGKNKSILVATGNRSEVKPLRKSRRLVKKNAVRGNYESAYDKSRQHYRRTERCDKVRTSTSTSNGLDASSDDSITILDSEQEYSPIRSNQQSIDTAFNDLNGLRNVNVPRGSTLQDGFSSRGNRNEDLVDVEDMSNLNNVTALNGSNLWSDNVQSSQERMPPPRFSDFEDVDRVNKDVDVSGESENFPTSTELSCVICWTDFSSTRGVLSCGHRFCYSCIQDWADHMASERKVSTCPLCKASFTSITKVDDAASSDQKIYSQTIPYASSTARDIFVLPEWGFSGSGAQISGGSVCCECRSREPEDLLESCQFCHNRWIHSYCLDPPLFPWTCINCRGLRMLYQRLH